MKNKELLNRIEKTHEWTAKGILELRELTEREDKYTQQAIDESRAEILTNIQLAISEMEILAIELESGQ